MIRTCLLLLASILTASAAVEDFLGDWEVHAKEPSAYVRTEIKYPVRMTITREGDHLKGIYTDQFGYTAQFSLIATINDDRDIIFVHAGGTKEDSFSPIHHAKVIDGKLKGYCFNQFKQLEWTGTRKKP